MSSEALAAMVGAILSGVMAYTPGVKTKWAALPSDWKRLIMAGLMLAVAAGAYGLGCAGFGPISCDRPGAEAMARVFAAALVANQTTYDVLPRFEPPPSATAGAASASA